MHLTQWMALTNLEQTAEQMGRSVPSVRNLLNRALVQLAAFADEASG